MWGGDTVFACSITLVYLVAPGVDPHFMELGQALKNDYRYL